MPSATPLAFPYPDGDDPVTDYPAIAQELAELLDRRHRSAQGSTGGQATPAGGGFGQVLVGGVRWEDWNAFTVGSPNIILDGVGRYRVSAMFQWVGQTGGVGWTMGRIRWYDPTATVREDGYGGMFALNAGFKAEIIADVANGADFFTVEAASAAGAAGGNVYVVTTIERLL